MCAYELLLLLALVTRVRTMTPTQVARLLGLPQCCADRLIRRCVRRGLLRTTRVLLSEPAPSTGPIAAWSVGGPDPDIGSISYQLRTRATASARFATIVVATCRAARLLGGVVPNLGRPFQMSHDLILSEALIWLTRNEPLTVDRFLGEDFLRRRESTVSGFVPDAAIVDDDAQVVEVIEGGGNYGTRRIEQLHTCSAKAGVGWRIF